MAKVRNQEEKMIHEEHHTAPAKKEHGEEGHKEEKHS
jgi:hypothetical protein